MSCNEAHRRLVEAIAESMWMLIGSEEGDWEWLIGEFPAQAERLRNQAAIALERGGYHQPRNMDMSLKEALIGGSK